MKRRWVIAGLLLLVTMINYTDRTTLSVLVTEVRKSLSLTESDYSQVISLFLVAYAIMYAGSGYIVDRLGTRLGMTFFVFTWSICQMLHGAARGKWSLGACRFMLGLAEPGSFPAATKAIREWFPPEQRAIGVGIFNAGSSLGAAAAAPLAAWLGLRYGWRTAFVFTGALGLIWLCFWLLIYQPREKTNEVADRGEWRRVLKSRSCLTLIAARFLSDPVIYFIIFWFPAYLAKERGFDLKKIGQFAWLPYVFGDVGYLFGGWLSGRFMRMGKSASRSREIVMGIGAAILPIAIFAPLASSAGVAIGITCGIVFGHAVWIANLMTLPADLFRGCEVGTAAGFSGMGGAVGGSIANLATGYVVSHFSYSPMFVWAGLMHPLAFLIVWRYLPPSATPREPQIQCAA
jgi:ACS family hexuronate transporter-like MFS transporter